jgi:lipid-A-disaccharide synthase
MGAAGLESLFPMHELSLMGLLEVLPRVRQLRRRLRETEVHALAGGPDVIVTIDSPGFNFRLAKRIRRQGAPLVHYVAPQVWAWHPRRALRMAEFFDHLMALLPFEPPLFEVAGLNCTFVGHPVLESGAAEGDGPAFRARMGIASEDRVLCVLPGSRMSEVSRMLPALGRAVVRLRKNLSGLHVVVPALAAVAAEVASAVADWGPDVHVIRGAIGKFDAFAASDAALAVSGTVSLELALARVPHAIAYRMHPATWQVARLVVKTPHVDLVNILLGRGVVPELLQDACTAERLADAALTLLVDADARTAQFDASATIAAALTPPGGSPAEAAAETVLQVLETAQAAAAES